MLKSIEPPRLLQADEPPAYLEERPQARSNFLIAVDHASARIPRLLGTLGLPAEELERHIAWDIGALGVARGLAERLDARLIAQNYSRLVIDCNRDPRVPTSIPLRSEAVDIPGNQQLSDADRETRRREIFDPYHDHLRAVIDERTAAGRRTILIAQHSMTDVYHGTRRGMHGAVLYNRDRRLAGLLLELLRREPGLVVADNEPYFVSDETDFTIPRHAEACGLLHVEIEIRQDLVTSEAGQREWAARLANALVVAENTLSGEHR